MIVDKDQRLRLSARDGREISVRLSVNPRAKRLILRLDLKAGEAVAVAPHHRLLGDAVSFAQDRADWIADRLASAPARTELSPGTTFPLRGAPCRIETEPVRGLARIEPGPPVRLVLPGDAGTAPARARRYLRKIATEDISAAVARHSRMLGVTPAAVRVKDTRSRWGSCTARGELSFSWRLIFAPPRVLDYVAAHECAHLLEMNHGPGFWAQVSRCIPDWKRDRDWLRRHGEGLHAIAA